jgi:ribosomal peptide maturation radical SAM protein 1
VPTAVDTVFNALDHRAVCLLVVPPFHTLYRPSLAVHTLQASAERRGIAVAVLYANLLFAEMAGERLYEAVAAGLSGQLLGERVFAEAAFGQCRLRDAPDLAQLKVGDGFAVDDLCRLELLATEFCRELGRRIARLDCAVVGCSTTFEQTNASVAVLRAVKSARPDITTIIGGANCEGEMAEGIVSLGAPVDYVFSGEAEQSFPRFLSDFAVGRRPTETIVRGAPCRDMDAVPEPVFSEYFDQLPVTIPDWRERPIWIPWETSRGCWWGQKSHCTFCGLNGEGMVFREKTPDRVLGGLERLAAAYPGGKIAMSDNIMPHSYFRTVIPRIASARMDVEFFYEQKANLSLAKVRALASAGVTRIQPGIEALSTPLLRRMKKGVSARQNIALLRYCRSLDIQPFWQLLYDLPGDTVGDYGDILDLMPLLHHLNPPGGMSRLVIDRFSPYFGDSDASGISNISPAAGYSSAFPAGADLMRLAYHFQGDYRSALRDDPGFFQRMRTEVDAWILAWNQPNGGAPALHLTPLSESAFLLFDTRKLPGCSEVRILAREEAHAALVSLPLHSPLAEWAVAAKLATGLDGRSTPLATADADVVAEFETSAPTLHSKSTVVV